MLDSKKTTVDYIIVWPNPPDVRTSETLLYQLVKACFLKIFYNIYKFKSVFVFFFDGIFPRNRHLQFKRKPMYFLSNLRFFNSSKFPRVTVTQKIILLFKNRVSR